MYFPALIGGWLWRLDALEERHAAGAPLPWFARAERRVLRFLLARYAGLRPAGGARLEGLGPPRVRVHAPGQSRVPDPPLPSLAPTYLAATVPAPGTLYAPPRRGDSMRLLLKDIHAKAKVEDPPRAHAVAPLWLAPLLLLGVGTLLLMALSFATWALLEQGWGPRRAAPVRRLPPNAATAIAAGPAYSPAARDEILRETAVLRTWLESYRRRYGSYPSSLCAIVSFGSGTLVEDDFRDPWGLMYGYWPGSREPVLGTYGADRAKGGVGENEDWFIQ